MATAKRLYLRIPNIPEGYADDIGPEMWAWLKVQHPSDYEQAQRQIKAHDEALQGQPEKAEATKAIAPSEGNSSKGGGK